jgi:hypothetical protein
MTYGFRKPSLAIFILVGVLAAAQRIRAGSPEPPITVVSPCECHDNHGEHRWSVKNDSSLPPTDASLITSATPSDVLNWPGPGVHMTQSSERTGIENDWYAITGRVIAVKVEADGDLHLALQDATSGKPGVAFVRYLQNHNGASCAQRSLIGRTPNFRFTLARPKR